MWKVKFDDGEHQWVVHQTFDSLDVSFYWYSCELAHMMKDALNLLEDMGFDVHLQRK